MSSTAVIILVVLVIAALIVVGVVVAQGTRKREAARTEASELRADPVASGAGVHDASLEARQAEEEAERLRREAEQAHARAEQAKQGVAVEEARQEDQLRQADRLDPDVNHRSDDYDPSAPAAGPVEPVDAPREDSPPKR